MSNLNNTPGFFSTPAQNAYNPNAEKAPACWDMPNQLLLNYTYALPIGRGKQLNVNSKATGRSGWRMVRGRHSHLRERHAAEHLEQHGPVQPANYLGHQQLGPARCGFRPIHSDEYQLLFLQPRGW